MNKKLILGIYSLLLVATSFCMEQDDNPFKKSKEYQKEVDAIQKEPYRTKEKEEEKAILPKETKADIFYDNQIKKINSDQTLTEDEKNKQLEQAYILWCALKRGEIKYGDRLNEPSTKEKIMGLLQSKYDSLPPKVKMLTDKMAEHPQIAKAAACGTAEACGWWCCPGFTYAVNLFLGGYAARIVQTEWWNKKEKEL